MTPGVIEPVTVAVPVEVIVDTEVPEALEEALELLEALDDADVVGDKLDRAEFEVVGLELFVALGVGNAEEL